MVTEGAHVTGTASRGQLDVYLHIGLTKTGTSHLQQVLWLSRERLAGAGVLVPGRSRQSQTMAVWDLMGRRPRGADQPEVAGSWQELVSAAMRWSGSQVVISEEFLANATPRQVRLAVRAFAPARVHVVVTVRDLGRVIGSVWQQNLAKGRTWSWSEFVGAVRDPENGPATAGVGFWLRQDLLRILDTWEVAVPRQLIHLVTVPPPGSPRHLLLERFAAATHLDLGALASNQPETNVSIGTAEAEMLRRLNLGLAGRLNERQYNHAVQKGVQSALRGRMSSPRIRLPAGELEWVTDRATTMVRALDSRGYEVTGDLRDLIPSAAVTSESRPDDVDDSELAEAALAALVELTKKYAQLWSRTRKKDRTSDAGVANRLASSARARGYRARIGALEAADRNRWMSRAVNAYLRRSWRSS
ncbi:MAG: hypothetical protein H0V07_12580 [Propionibacteriales bacterium]|nr:hypothetical protein [Propionibacteriales bacterium]